MKVNQLSKIKYTKTKSDVTERTILPTSIPAKVITSIDVSDMPTSEAAELLAEYTEYLKYKELHMSKLFNFNNWLIHTDSKVDIPSIKYRSFTPAKIELLT